MAAVSSVLVGSAIAGAAIAAGTAIAGEVVAGSARGEAEKILQKGKQEIAKLQPPKFEGTINALQALREKGMVSPQVEAAILQADTEMRTVTGDPQAVQAQKESLSYLENIRNQGGLTAQDRDFLAKTQDELLGIQKAQADSTKAAMASRGMRGSGAEMASLLAGQQQTTQGLSRAGTALAALAQQRRDSANRDLFGAASGMRAQAWEEQAQQARAQDAINQFNAMQQQGVQGRNIDRDLASQQYNNTMAYQTIMGQGQLEHQGYALDADKTAMFTGQNNRTADLAIQKGEQLAGMIGGLGSSLGTIGTGFADSYMKLPKEDAGKLPQKDAGKGKGH